MGIRFAARVGARKRSIIPAGMPSDSTLAQVRPRIDGGFSPVQANSTGFDPDRWANDRKKGRPQGERPREEIVLLLHCFRAAVRHSARIPHPQHYVNYELHLRSKH